MGSCCDRGADTSWHVPTSRTGRPSEDRETKRARGKRLKDLRIAFFGKKVSQEQLAEQLGEERTVVVKIETGRNAVTAGDLQRDLAKAFGLLEEDFVAT